MPIDYRVDHEHRLVLAEGRGDVTAEDIFAYQREAWGRADVHGYDEIVDMSAVGRIVEPTRERQPVAARDDVAGIRRQDARHRFEQRGLAGAVGTDESKHLAGLHVE